MYSINPTSYQVDHSEECFDDECLDTYCMSLKLLAYRFINVYHSRDLSLIDSNFNEIIDVTDVDNWNIIFSTFRKAKIILEKNCDFDEDFFQVCVENI